MPFHRIFQGIDRIQSFVCSKRLLYENFLWELNPLKFLYFSSIPKLSAFLIPAGLQVLYNSIRTFFFFLFLYFVNPLFKGGIKGVLEGPLGHETHQLFEHKFPRHSAPEIEITDCGHFFSLSRDRSALVFLTRRKQRRLILIEIFFLIVLDCQYSLCLVKAF